MKSKVLSLLLLFMLSISSYSQIRTANDLGELRDIGGNNLVVLFFSASWSGPSKMQMSALNALHLEITNGYKVDLTIVKVDVDKAEDITNYYFIRNVPQIIILWNNIILRDLGVGYKPKQVLSDEIIPLFIHYCTPPYKP